MKSNKIIAILMAILLTFALCACGGESESSADSSTNSSTDSSDNSFSASSEESSDKSLEETSEETSEEASEDASAVVGELSGKFMLYSMTAEGVTMDYEMLKMIGMDVAYLEIKGEDFEMNMGDGDTVNGTVDTENKKFVGPDGEAIDYVIDGEKVTLAVEGAEMTFVKEGSDLLTSTDTSEDTSENPTDTPVEGGIYGKYICVGESYTGDNYSEPYTPSYVILNDGGEGIFCSNETEMDLAWSLEGETFTGTVTAFGEMPMNGTLKDGVLEVVYGDGFYMQFEKSAEDTTAPDDTDGATLKNYLGDWHGMLMFDECTGDYKGNNEITAEIVARIIVDENGKIVPFLAVALGEDSVTKNFKNVEMAHYTEDGFDFMMMQGEFYGLPISFDSYIEAKGEVLNIYVKAEDEKGNSLAFYGCLRHLDDEWDKENDYMYFPDDMYDFYYGKSLEEIVELYGLKATDLPK